MFTIQEVSTGIKAGTYEAMIKSVEVRATSGGKPYIDAVCRIREGQNAPRMDISFKIWKAKVPSPADESVDGYLSFRIFELARAAKISVGTSYSSLGEMFAAIEGSPVVAKVVMQEYNGKSYPVVDHLEPSSLPLTPAELKFAEDLKVQRLSKIVEDVAAAPTPAPARATAPAQAATQTAFTELADENVPF